MRNSTIVLALAGLALSAAPALAGDPVKGENDFKKCKACHAIVAADGTEIQKGGKTGPNLYGVIGRQVGSEPAFLEKYGPSILLAGADGTLWDEALIAAYVTDPTAWLKEKTGDAAAKSKMALKLTKGGEDVAAYLASVAPTE
jgi:cytochrome c